MNAHGISQNEVARRASTSSVHLSQIMCGKSNPSPGVLRKLHNVLFQHTEEEERIMPAEVRDAVLEEGGASRDGGERRRWGGCFLTNGASLRDS